MIIQCEPNEPRTLDRDFTFLEALLNQYHRKLWFLTTSSACLSSESVLMMEVRYTRYGIDINRTSSNWPFFTDMIIIDGHKSNLCVCVCNIKMSYQYRDLHVRDTTVSWSSYLYQGNPIPGKDGRYNGTGPWSIYYVGSTFLSHPQFLENML